MLQKIFFLFAISALALSACTTLDVHLEQKSTATNNPTAIPTATIITPTHSDRSTSEYENTQAALKTKLYANTKYGFSMEYPGNFEITAGENDNAVYIGEKIRVRVTDKNPLECRGDCDVVESTESVKIAGFEMTQVTGYMGSIGGNIPQRYLRYILQKGQHYYMFTLYALSFHAKIDDPSKIWPLEEKDIVPFEQILATLKFKN